MQSDESVNERLRVFACPAEGKKLRTDRDAVDLISDSQGAELIVIPVERLDDDFFILKTRVAGEFLQKFVTYGKRVAIVGDISRHVEQSTALRDFILESNRGSQIRFVSTNEELERRIERSRII